MCGIVGLINIGDVSILIKCLSFLNYRGPDYGSTKWFEKWNSGFGHRRLSIIDLSVDGNQPMTSKDGRYWITYNGEIYNYKEIEKELRVKCPEFRVKTKSDTEILLYAYIEWGEKCLEKLNGMFAFAIFDTMTGEVFAARDRLGIKPFYYTEVNGGLIFASEIKAILETGLVNKEPDYYSLLTPTRFQIAPYTGFKNIFKLLPGHFLKYKDSTLNIKKYWDIRIKEVNEEDNNATEELDSLLNDSVKLQMVADVPVGLLLSGGLDSSIIAALMRKNYSGDINSFTIKFKKSDQKFEKVIDDSYYANKVAQQFGLIENEIEVEPDVVSLLEKIVWHLDEPLSDPAAINTYLISMAAREKGIKVLLNGMGGDEIFGGYRKQLACLKADEYQNIVPLYIRRLFEKTIMMLPSATNKQGIKSIRWVKRFLSFASLPQYERFIVSDLSMSKEMFENLFLDQMSYEDSYFYKSQQKYYLSKEISYLTQMCLNDTNVMLPEHNLNYSDKASMAASVEGRPPMVDHRIAEFMFSLHPKFRIRKNIQKWLLKKVSEKYLSKEIVYRSKAPFGSPLRSWIRNDLKEMVGDLLSEDSVKARGIYDYKVVKKIIDDDRKGLNDNAHIIWTMLNTEVWFRKFFY